MFNVLYRIVVMVLLWFIAMAAAHMSGADLANPISIWVTAGIGAVVGLWLTWPNRRADAE